MTTNLANDPALNRLYADLGLKRLNPLWAKLEIFFGLAAAGTGMSLMTSSAPDMTIVAGLTLFVLGGYLAMAGHRSHLYQSSNLVAAYLADEIRKQKA